MANTLNGLTVAVITFVILAIIVGIGGSILDKIEETQCDYYWNSTSNQCLSAAQGAARESLAINATNKGSEGIETFGDWLPTIAVILVSALVIGIIASYFVFRSEE